MVVLGRSLALVLTLLAAAAVAQDAPSDAELEAMMAELAAVPGHTLEGDGWRVAVPDTGRWQSIVLAGTQSNCIALQRLPDAATLSALLTVCPRSAPGSGDAVAATLDTEVGAVEALASDEGYRLVERRRGDDVLPGVSVSAFAYRSDPLKHMAGARAFGYRAVRCPSLAPPVCLVFALDGLAHARADAEARALAEVIDSLEAAPVEP